MAADKETKKWVKMSKKRTFTPEQAKLWAVLNASHIGFSKILEEFLDNAISAQTKEICIRIVQMAQDSFVLTVEAPGVGIPEDGLAKAFAAGHVPDREAAGIWRSGCGLLARSWRFASWRRRDQGLLSGTGRAGRGRHSGKGHGAE